MTVSVADICNGIAKLDHEQLAEVIESVARRFDNLEPSECSNESRERIEDSMRDIDLAVDTVYDQNENENEDDDDE